MKLSSELEELCRSRITEAAIDGRTSVFAAIVRSPGSITQRLQEIARLPPAQIQRIFRDFVSERYADFYERREDGLAFGCETINFLLAQGYKRGLVWRGIPLGKTCWDISIYQQLLQELRPRTLIEFGTGLGASTLFFLDHCRIFAPDAKVITIDRNLEDVDPQIVEESSIKFIHGDVKQLAMLLPSEELARLPHPWLIVEDCHSEISLIVQHVQPLMVSGDYLVIEDMGLTADGSIEIDRAIQSLPRGILMVDTFYTDMFGRNLTCAPDSIFKRM